MTPRFVDILDEKFRLLGVDLSNVKRAERLETDQATFSRLISGRLPLTSKRASKWAALLFRDDAIAATEFEKSLLDASENRSQVLTVSDFFESIVSEGGQIAAERISDLFEALKEVDSPLISIEYRDLPRTVPSARYEEVGSNIGKAIARGMAYAMFQPFGSQFSLEADNANSQVNHSRAVKAYMLKIRDECRNAYLSVRHDAIAEAKTIGLPDQKRSELQTDISVEQLIDQRVRLYEPIDEYRYVGTGFQSKQCYLSYSTYSNGTSKRHERILQWVSTPRQDILLYRSKGDVDYTAMRDSFFPINHYFDLKGHLPTDCQKANRVIKDETAATIGLPSNNYNFWKIYKPE
jgi:hypothetical protein